VPVLISSRLDDDFLVGMIYPEIQAATPAAVALDFMYYNFARMHQTLRVTPAMETGVSDHVWSIEDIVGLLA